MRGIAMSASPESRRITVDNLIEDALDAFKQRAEWVRSNLGAPGYRFGHIAIDTSADGRQQNYRRGGMMMRTVAADASIAEPALEAGQCEFAVTVSDNIIID